MAALLICYSATAQTVDEAWEASPATNDTQWAQVNMAPVSPSNSGNSEGIYHGVGIKLDYVGRAEGLNNTNKMEYISITYNSTGMGDGCSILVDRMYIAIQQPARSFFCFAAIPAGARWEITTDTGSKLRKMTTE